MNCAFQKGAAEIVGSQTRRVVVQSLGGLIWASSAPSRAKRQVSHLLVEIAKMSDEDVFEDLKVCIPQNDQKSSKQMDIC